MEYIKRKPIIFTISGSSGSGKSFISNILKDYFKERIIVLAFGDYIKSYANRITQNPSREFLQSLGIDLIKNRINNKLLINRIIEDIEVFSYFYDIIVINDARLIEEIQSLKNKYQNLISIKLVRENYENNLNNVERNHITENSYKEYNKFNYILYNNGNENLKKDIIKIMNEVCYE